MRVHRKSLLVCATLAVAAAAALAHFQVLVPSTDIVTGQGRENVDFDILFTHPMEDGPVMEMAAPKQFGVLAAGRRFDLLPGLKSRHIDGKTAYTYTCQIRRPGDHVVYLEPAPYWEPAEGKMIIHYTKVVINAMGKEDGWDAMVGFPVEIEPLVRPYGLWTGNAFRGIVKHHGKPVPFAEVEVEYLNRNKAVTPPADPFITQVIKADANGAFTYAMPRAGWWAFAALIEGEKPMKNPAGKDVPVELGGLLWVKTVDMK